MLRHAHPLCSPQGPLQRLKVSALKNRILLIIWGLATAQTEFASSRPSPLLAAGALAKIESVCDTIFYLYSRSQTSLHGYINKKALRCKAFNLCGKEGIRTPETLLTFTRFPGGPVQPLLHLSILLVDKDRSLF